MQTDNTGCLRYYLTWENKTDPNINKSETYMSEYVSLKKAGLSDTEINKIVLANIKSVTSAVNKTVYGGAGQNIATVR